MRLLADRVENSFGFFMLPILHCQDERMIGGKNAEIARRNFNVSNFIQTPLIEGAHARGFYLLASAAKTDIDVRSGPTSSSILSIASSSASRMRARLTRLLMVPTAHSQIAAASS